MPWIIIGSAIVVVGAAISLWATLGSQRDIASGTPKFESVADITGVWSRDALDAILGSRDADDRYCAGPDAIRAIRRPVWKRWLDSEASDVLCMVAALVAPFVYRWHGPIAIALVSLGGAWLVLGYVYAGYVVVGSGESSDEESPM